MNAPTKIEAYDTFIVQATTYNSLTSSNNVLETRLTIPALSGYTPIGVVGWQGGTTYFSIVNLYVGDDNGTTKLFVTVRRWDSSTINIPWLNVKILYKKGQ